MSGLAVLYASEASSEQGWAEIPDRDKTGRLREVFWLKRAESKIGTKRTSSVQAKCSLPLDRDGIGRVHCDPGDAFVYTVATSPEAEGGFEWFEVTEVFTSVAAAKIRGAMGALNGIEGKQSIDFSEFRNGLARGLPSSAEQISSADKVIQAIKRKSAKTSYQELVKKYGYGTLVVGMPLWFAFLPEDPSRAENAQDVFHTRTKLALERFRQDVLEREDCPFKQVIVVWDTTYEAVVEWESKRSARYEDCHNSSVTGPRLHLGVTEWCGLVDRLMRETTVRDSESPYLSLHLSVTADKKMIAKGPFPEIVQHLQAFAQSQGLGR